MARVNETLVSDFKHLFALCLVAAVLAFAAVPASAQNTVPDGASANAEEVDAVTYVDLVDLADRSEMVLRAEIRRQTVVEPERSPGLAPGYVRLYIEARTRALIAGTAAVGESLVYLVDVPVNERGKPDKYKNREVLLFADRVPGRPGSIQLTAKQAQLDYTSRLEERLRPILTELASRETPPVITGVNDALAVPGTLAGESETQIFLATKDRSPVSITVLRRPGQPPAWGVSWGEIIDSAARPPRPETLRWYRLACALPEKLPSGANLARDANARQLAETDYRFVMRELGPCVRAITEGNERVS